MKPHQAPRGVSSARRCLLTGASSALLLAACGGGSDSDDDDPPGAASDEPPEASDPERSEFAQQVTNTPACSAAGGLNVAAFSRRFDQLYAHVMGPASGGNGLVYREKRVNNTVMGCCVDTSLYDGNRNTVKSEGQGYGMVLAASRNDRRRFDRLWRFTRDVMKKNANAKTFDWIVSFEDNRKLGTGSAPDGEFWIITGLLMAAHVFGTLRNDASARDGYRGQARAILEEIRPLYNDWFRTNLTGADAKYNGVVRFYPYEDRGVYNASYCNAAFFQYWADTLPGQGWGALVPGNRAYLQTVGGKNGGRGWDYSNIAGSFTNPYDRPADGFDACRIAMNQAFDRWWQGFEGHVGAVDRFADTLDRNPFGGYDGTLAFKAMHACMVVGNGRGCDQRLTRYTWALLNESVEGEFGQYYAGLLTVIGAGLLGQRIRPFGIGPKGNHA
jgi:endo-1,4-beta-D-glucanase Y